MILLLQKLRKILKKYSNTVILEKALSFAFDINADVPAALNGDPTQAKQILVNLAGNAIKFTEKGGVHITVALQEKTSEEIVLSFAVSDTGIGIPEDKLVEIFDSFGYTSKPGNHP